jgi:hypothetical protein
MMRSERESPLSIELCCADSMADIPVAKRAQRKTVDHLRRATRAENPESHHRGDRRALRRSYVL